MQLVFLLPANKHPTSYKDVSAIRYQRLQNLVWIFFPTIAYADLETAIHNAVKTVWPGCEVTACLFHLRQSWWWKIQSLGLSKQHRKKVSEVSQCLKKTFGLSLWPPAEVSDYFALECLSNLPNDKRLELFCSYLLENYIDADSTFGPNVPVFFPEKIFVNRA